MPYFLKHLREHFVILRILGRLGKDLYYDPERDTISLSSLLQVHIHILYSNPVHFLKPVKIMAELFKTINYHEV